MQLNEPSALTLFLCDVVDLQERRITRDDLRQRWKQGKYRGVRADYAKWQMGTV